LILLKRNRKDEKNAKCGRKKEGRRGGHLLARRDAKEKKVLRSIYLWEWAGQIREGRKRWHERQMDMAGKERGKREESHFLTIDRSQPPPPDEKKNLKKEKGREEHCCRSGARRGGEGKRDKSFTASKQAEKRSFCFASRWG